jgi:hypothetical protein
MIWAAYLFPVSIATILEMHVSISRLLVEYSSPYYGNNQFIQLYFLFSILRVYANQKEQPPRKTSLNKRFLRTLKQEGNIFIEI